MINENVKKYHNHIEQNVNKIATLLKLDNKLNPSIMMPKGTLEELVKSFRRLTRALEKGNDDN